MLELEFSELECSELDIRGVVYRSALKPRNSPFSLRRWLTLYLLRHLLGLRYTHNHINCLFVKSKQRNPSGHNYDNEHINVMNVKACEPVVSFSWM